MKFVKCYTDTDYPFLLAFIKNSEGDIIGYILKEYPNLDYTRFKSLTNNVENIIGFICDSVGYNPVTNWYQYDKDGLFKLEFKIRFSGPPLPDLGFHGYVKNLQWKYFAKDLKAFEVLFTKKGQE